MEHATPYWNCQSIAELGFNYHIDVSKLVSRHMVTSIVLKAILRLLLIEWDQGLYIKFYEDRV